MEPSLGDGERVNCGRNEVDLMHLGSLYPSPQMGASPIDDEVPSLSILVTPSRLARPITGCYVIDGETETQLSSRIRPS